MQISMECPFCSHLTIFSPEAYIADEFQMSGEPYTMAVQCRCSNQKCRRVVYCRMEATLRGGKYVPDERTIRDVYPGRVPKAPEGTPEEAGADLIEAIKCLDVGAYKGAVVMCRRAIQSAVVSLKGEGKDLYHQIDDLLAKGEVTPELAEWAHSIRDAGKVGAHADLNISQDIDKGDAREIIEFTEEFFRYRFTMKEKVKRRAKRQHVQKKTQKKEG